MEWLAVEKTKVSGTFPPRNTRGWTGYIEKDTAGQTNIYSVEVSNKPIIHLHNLQDYCICICFFFFDISVLFNI